MSFLAHSAEGDDGEDVAWYEEGRVLVVFYCNLQKQWACYWLIETPPGSGDTHLSLCNYNHMFDLICLRMNAAFIFETSSAEIFFLTCIICIFNIFNSNQCFV